MLYVIAPRVYSFCVLILFRLMARTNQLARKRWHTGYQEVAPAEKEGDEDTEDTEELLQALRDDSADEEEVAPTEEQLLGSGLGSGLKQEPERSMVVPAEVQWLLQQSETEKKHYWLRMEIRKRDLCGYLFKEADGSLTWKDGDTLLYHNDGITIGDALDDKFDRAYAACGLLNRTLEPKPEPAVDDRGSKRVKVEQKPKPEPAGDRGERVKQELKPEPAGDLV